MLILKESNGILIKNENKNDNKDGYYFINL